jgi:hypothetical protein
LARALVVTCQLHRHRCAIAAAVPRAAARACLRSGTHARAKRNRPAGQRVSQVFGLGTQVGRPSLTRGIVGGVSSGRRPSNTTSCATGKKKAKRVSCNLSALCTYVHKVSVGGRMNRAILFFRNAVHHLTTRKRSKQYPLDPKRRSKQQYGNGLSRNTAATTWHRARPFPRRASCFLCNLNDCPGENSA